MDQISVTGARIHNLKDVNVDLPKGRLIAFTGVSGSGKSSLAFDILYEEGRKRYLQSIGLSLRETRSEDSEPFDEITGLPPAISVEQNTIRQSNPRSVVGTKTKLLDYIKLLYSLDGRDRDGIRVNLPLEAFAFNLPAGMCSDCYGRGFVIDFDLNKIIEDPTRTAENICSRISSVLLREIQISSKDLKIDWHNTSYDALSESAKRVLLYGGNGLTGIISWIDNRMKNKPNQRQHLERMYGANLTCKSCEGTRVNEQARSVFIGGKHVGEVCSLTITDLLLFEEGLESEQLSPQGRKIANRIAAVARLFIEVGLSHLTILRSIPTLSGGEMQRLYLMFHLQSQFDSLLYIFDEPTAGLHESESHVLMEKLRSLTSIGNTVVVVEHDMNVIRNADYIVELGPYAGKNGGNLLFQGSLPELMKSENSLLRPYLTGEKRLPEKLPGQRREVTIHTQNLVVRGASVYNLRNVTAEFPLGVMIGVAGVSGSGKSTLISDTLVPLLQYHFDTGKDDSDEETDILTSPREQIGLLEGWQHVQKCVVVTQEPIGRYKMSLPITYVGIWDKIRSLFADEPASAALAFTPSHFSFNTEQGACPICKGGGTEEVDMGPLGFMSRPCDSCKGTRYKSEILQITYRGYTIHDILMMSAQDALELFSDIKSVALMLQTLIQVGLGYITLGQPAPTLSGGEAQRIKLAKELGKAQKCNTLYVLDEPTTGLSGSDIEKLISLLDQLVDQGNTVIITEHNTSVLSYCDWLIELGPGGGSSGGTLITSGTPEMVKLNPDSIIGPYLK